MELTGNINRLQNSDLLVSIVINQVENCKVSNMSAGYQTEFDRENGISSIIDTLGGSNITQVFVHSVTSLENITELTETVTGLEKYPERSLLVARPDDLVCVVDKVDNQYLQFLSKLGIGLSNKNIIVASKDFQQDSDATLSDLLMSNCEALLAIRNLVKRNKKIVLNPYIASPKEFKLVAILETILGRKVHILGGNSDIVDYANHKHNVRAKALELGLPVPEGDVVVLQVDGDGKPLDLTPMQTAIHRFINKTGRVLIKGSVGASGTSLVIAENNPESIQKALGEIAGRIDNMIYLVEVMFDVVVSPNVLMYIDPDYNRITSVSVTDQILSDDLMHEGNIYPSTATTLNEMLLSAEKLSLWLQAEGYSGLVGFDFGEYYNTEKGQFGHFLAEVNPRTNAATYSKSLMEHLNRNQKKRGGPYIEAFLSANIKTNARSFAQLREWYGHLFFNPKIGKGLVPYNIGCLRYGKFTLAVFGRSRNEVMEMYEDFKILSTKE